MQPLPSQQLPASESQSIPQIETYDEAPRGLLKRLAHSAYHSAAFLTSFIFHFALIMVLAMFTLTSQKRTQPLVTVIEPDMVQDLETFEIELDQLDVVSTEMATASMPVSEMGMAGEAIASMSAPVLQQEALDPTETVRVELSDIAMISTDSDSLIREIPSGTIGSAQEVVSNYQEAMDQITQELIWMMSKNKVLVIWLFDQSESMKDDQQRIRERIGRVYTEIGLTEEGQGDVLTTAVTSYGQGFQQLTQAPTSNLSEIQAAIDAIQIDQSGEEMACSAVMEALSRHRKYAQIADRKVALIMVTDESGNMNDNGAQLENAIKMAQQMDCRLFVMGREAMFGYPYAHYEWRHPFSGEMHLLRIDRGPETAYVEQLQTDGYGKRWDAMTSGFGPYEQVRLAKETGGRFFMLPGQEDDIHYVTDRKYDAKTMDFYRPDLRPRAAQVSEIKGDALKSLVTNVVYDLNPFQEDRKEVLTIRHWYSKDPNEMAKQVRKEQADVIPYGQYLDKAIKVLEKNRDLRDASTSLRWQANYDLMLGQLYAYRCRAYEYGVSSELFLKNPTPPDPKREPYMEFRGWELRTNSNLVAPDKTQDDADRAKELLTFVTKEYAGTPWATRAAWEVKRGFGSGLRPYYFDTRRRKSDKKVPIPKL
ncbi:vWA domain-containing protein [Bremerella cremea]|uniref:vWA domain-containing protein n=1 Tax=Bremerella cremea TaxID=1031537 RepID=UPI0031EABA00